MRREEGASLTSRMIAKPEPLAHPLSAPETTLTPALEVLGRGYATRLNLY